VYRGAEASIKNFETRPLSQIQNVKRMTNIKPQKLIRRNFALFLKVVFIAKLDKTTICT
jgi:hypothetical protein